MTKIPATYSWKLAFELSECEHSGGLSSKSEVRRAGLVLAWCREPGWSPWVQEQLLEARLPAACVFSALKFYAFKRMIFLSNWARGLEERGVQCHVLLQSCL